MALHITPKQLEAYQRDGYLVVRDAIAPAYLDPVRDMIGERVDAVARERYAAGELPSPYDQEPFGRRYAVMREHLPESGAKFFGPTELSTRPLYDLYTHPAITDVVRVLIGSEVTPHGISVIRGQAPRQLGHGNSLASGQPLLQRGDGRETGGKHRAHARGDRVGAIGRR